MRHDRLYLLDIVEAADNVAFHIDGKTCDAFVGDRTTRAAVLHEFTVIGEAAGRLSEELLGRHPHVPWPKVVAFRNVVVHEYFGLDWRIVWSTATELAPVLRGQVAAILRAEFPEGGGPAILK